MERNPHLLPGPGSTYASSGGGRPRPVRLVSGLAARLLRGKEQGGRTEGAEQRRAASGCAVTELGSELWGGKSFGHFSWAAESPFRL
jgi:hypothetical protein